jgi:ankyrin repeat protein
MDIVRALEVIKRGGSLSDFINSFNKNTNLHKIEELKEEAIRANNVEILKYLFTCSPHIYYDGVNETFIHCAIFYDSKECFKYLVENFKECINHVHSGNDTILAHAILFFNPEFVKILLDNGAEIYINGSDQGIMKILNDRKSEEKEVLEANNEIKIMIVEYLSNQEQINNNAKSARVRK